MKLETTQLPQRVVTEWPVELTPQQREQLLQEKINRVQESLDHRTKKHDQQNCVCS